MIRATTPTQIFKFPIDPNSFSEVLITYKQCNRIVIEKNKEDLSISEVEPDIWEATFTLTQQETLMFKPNDPVKVQVRVLTSDGTAMASKIYDITVKDVLDDKVLKNAN